MVINRIFIKYPLYTQPIRNKDELAAFRMYYKDIHPNRRNYCLIVMGLNTALRISDLLKPKFPKWLYRELYVTPRKTA